MTLLNETFRHWTTLPLRHAWLVIICLLLFTQYISQFAQAAMRLPSANRECATCHIMWLKEFKRKDVTPLVPYEPKPVMPSGKQDVASAEPLCFSCHDGFVLDSRFLWEDNKHAHPVGQKPSKKTQIPKINGKDLLPLNDEGRVYCGTCHTAHGVDWDQKDTAVFMRVRNEDGQLCMACHKEKLKGSKHGSHPLKRKIQKLLKKPPQKLMQAGAHFAGNGEVVCQSCHKAHAAPEKKMLLVKNDNSQLCGECHINRYALSREQAGKNATHPVNIKPKQAKVPDELIESGAKLGSNGEVICQTCHRPHDAIVNTALLVEKNEKDRLCQNCHTNKRQVNNSKHDMSLAAKDSQNIRKQVAVESGPCSACHVPHKGNGPKMWARQTDPTLEPMAALCLSCHNKNGLAKKHTVGRHSHPVGADISRLQHAVSLPTFSESGFKWQDVMQGKVSCASCHDPHQWDPANKNNKARPGDKGNSSNRFLRIANDSKAELCKACHQKKWNVANSKHDMRKMAPDAENALGQTVEESGICGACHLVHNAMGSRLWARSDLTGQGTGYIACLGCHNKNGLAKKKILGKHSHPVNVPVKNLGITVKDNHWSHELTNSQTVNKQRTNKSTDKTAGNHLFPLPLYNKNGELATNSGRVGCGSCHDPHNWTPLDRLKTTDSSKIEGNTNSSFLRIPDKGMSSLCVNCHIDKRSIYFTKHDLSERLGKLSTQLNENHNGENKVDPQLQLSGPCTLCHRPHNAKGPALWARDKGPGKTAIAALCTDCHQQDGLAKGKLTGKHSHPVGVKIGKMKPDKHIPTFKSNGSRALQTKGNIDCASCHDAHRWDPENIYNRSLPIQAEEGDASNSFLRISANHNSPLCVNCHGDKKTIIGTDHDLRHTAPSASNVLGQEQDVSGLCGQCHVPHNSPEQAYLWAQDIGPGNDPIEQRCRSCHNPLGFAAHKNPQFAQHPQQIEIWSKKLREYIYPGKKLADMPMFKKNGKRSDFGFITCASCHNPHQWQADQAKGGKTSAKKSTQKNIEGDARSSFLRSRSEDNIVCKECHGNDAIYRYKYFHSKSAHKKHHMFR